MRRLSIQLYMVLLGVMPIGCLSSDSDIATNWRESPSDETPPEIVTVDILASLWPPNHTYQEFSIIDCVLSLTDDFDEDIDPETALQIYNVSSDEAELAIGSGQTCEDMVITSPTTFEVRAERVSGADGRVYTVNFAATDNAGNFTDASCRLVVPPKPGPKAVVIDSGCAYCVGNYCGCPWDPWCELTNCKKDTWEDNDLPEDAPMIPWDDVVYEYGNDSARVAIYAALCAGEDDWFRFPINSLNFDFYDVYTEALAEGTNHCGAGCGPSLPPAPENTMTIELYDAETLHPLGEATAQDGRIVDGPGGSGEAFSKDLLIHVFGPPTATYNYALFFEIHGYEPGSGSEDECEC